MTDAWRKPHYIVLEIENHKCTIVKRFGALGLKNLKVIDIRSSSPKSVKHLVELDPAEIGLLKNPPPEIKEIRAKMETGVKPSIWLESKGCNVCKNILQCDALLVSGKSMQHSTIMYSFLVPSFEAFKKINLDNIPSIVIHPRLHIGTGNPSIHKLTERAIKHSDLQKLTARGIFRKLRKVYKELGAEEAFKSVEDFIRNYPEIAKITL